MMNANMNPGARVPRNAIRVWQSNETIARLTGEQLTKSLRDAVMDHILRTHFEAKCNLVHPKDWPARGRQSDPHAFDLVFQRTD